MAAKDDARRPVQLLTVPEHLAGQRLDNFLLARLKGVPKTLVYRVIRKGEVRVNGKRAKPERKLVVDDQVRVPPLRLPEAQAQRKPGAALAALLHNAVLYDDEHVLVLNKPAGLAVHAGTGIGQGVIEALRALHPEWPALELVHRLDKGTSGCLLLAKSGQARRLLTEHFRQRRVHKVYHALVCGRWPERVRCVDASLQRQTPRGGERKVQVDDDGKAAQTAFAVLRHGASASLVEAQPLTGRTHQIRVHAALVGCPLVGDDKYCDPAALKAYARLGVRRLCLHAVELCFPHPRDGRDCRVTAPYDAAFSAALATLAPGAPAG